MAQVEVLDEFVTSGFLARLFGRTPLTIKNWRRYKDLPYVLIPGDASPTIRFRLEEVIEWADALGKRYNRKQARRKLNGRRERFDE